MKVLVSWCYPIPETASFCGNVPRIRPFVMLKSSCEGEVWSNGGMILRGENWSTGRKTLYSVGGRWKKEYGAMVEWYWEGKTEVLGEKHYTAWMVDEWMSMEQWWNDTDRGKLKYWEKNLSKCHFLHHKSQMRLACVWHRASKVSDQRNYKHPVRSSQ
jgi:hypothetical protein